MTPDWVRPECIEEYERECAMWILSDIPMCPTWRVPRDYCHYLKALSVFLSEMMIGHLFDAFIWHEVGGGRRVDRGCACGDSDRNNSVAFCARAGATGVDAATSATAVGAVAAVTADEVDQ